MMAEHTGVSYAHRAFSGEWQADWVLDRTLFRCCACGTSTWVASCINPHDTVTAARNLGMRVDDWVDDQFDAGTGSGLGEYVLCAKCNIAARNVTRPFGRRLREPLGRLGTANSPLRF